MSNKGLEGNILVMVIGFGLLVDCVVDNFIMNLYLGLIFLEIWQAIKGFEKAVFRDIMLILFKFMVEFRSNFFPAYQMIFKFTF